MTKNRVILRHGEPTNIHELLTYCKHYMEEVAFKNQIEVRMLGVIVNYAESMSNSHSSPIGKGTNWARDRSLPTHYPGWSGRIWIILSRSAIRSKDRRNDNWNHYSKSSRLLSQVYLHTTSGGYGFYDNPWIPKVPGIPGYCNNSLYPLSYGVKLWESDWPEFSKGIIHEEHQLKLEAVLANTEYTAKPEPIKCAVGSLIDDT